MKKLTLFVLVATASLFFLFSTVSSADTLVIEYKDGTSQSILLNNPSATIKGLRFDAGVTAGTIMTVPTNINLARGKMATQSSTSYGGAASRAVDGNTDGNHYNGSVSHTGNQKNPWWQVDLSNSYNIKSIRLWNRTDCCAERLSNFYVLVSNNPFAPGDLNTALGQPGVWNYYFPGTAGPQIDIPVHRTGRYVRIQLNGSNWLSLTEVQVFSE